MLLLFLPADHHQCLAKIRLRVSGRMRQRHKHLPLTQLLMPHILVHDRVATRKGILVPQPLPNPQCAMPLLGRPAPILFQNLIDDSDPRLQLWPPHRLMPAVPRRN